MRWLSRVTSEASYLADRSADSAAAALSAGYLLEAGDAAAALARLDRPDVSVWDGEANYLRALGLARNGRRNEAIVPAQAATREPKRRLESLILLINLY